MTPCERHGYVSTWRAPGVTNAGINPGSDMMGSGAEGAVGRITSDPVLDPQEPPTDCLGSLTQCSSSSLSSTPASGPLNVLLPPPESLFLQCQLLSLLPSVTSFGRSSAIVCIAPPPTFSFMRFFVLFSPSFPSFLPLTRSHSVAQDGLELSR